MPLMSASKPMSENPQDPCSIISCNQPKSYISVTSRQIGSLMYCKNQLRTEIRRIYTEIPTTASPKTFHMLRKLICG